MLRQIIKTSEPSFTLNLPSDMVGKTVEVIAFEIEDFNGNNKIMDKAEKIRCIQAITRKSLVDLSNYKFNRDEANNYNE